MYSSLLITTLSADCKCILLKDSLEKKIEVMQVNPSSANNSTELLSIMSETFIAVLLVNLGAVCFAANPFSKSILPDLERSIKNWFIFLSYPITIASPGSLLIVKEKSAAFSNARLIRQGK